MRTNYHELPSIAELEETLATETQRPIPIDKAEMHYATLDPFISFLNILQIDTTEITLDKTWQQVRMIAEKLINEATQRLVELDKSEIAAQAKRVYEYLSEEDTPTTADIIITPGSKATARAEKAIELYLKGYAPKILFTGGSPLYEKGQSEAKIYKQIAVKAGVPEEVIMTETKSITVADNIRSSLNLLDTQHFSYKSIIIVNSPYTQRRSYSHLAKYTSQGTQIYRVNCETRQGLRKDDWFTNEQGIFYILSEYYKLWFGLVINTN
jgi:uncharacterized SAM-binding protein YcdF (DUF218 family)